jgi:hypothetical protein
MQAGPCDRSCWSWQCARTPVTSWLPLSTRIGISLTSSLSSAYPSLQVPLLLRPL